MQNNGGNFNEKYRVHKKQNFHKFFKPLTIVSGFQKYVGFQVWEVFPASFLQKQKYNALKNLIQQCCTKTYQLKFLPTNLRNLVVREVDLF
jgi:hypothetical protein